MTYLNIILISLVVIIHIYILGLEMFFWNTKKGMRAFGLKSLDFANETKVMAANQGLYNGFLAAGLIWSLIGENTAVAFFFLGCVFIAGIYGAYSTKQVKILFIQTIPASLAIISLLF